MAGLFCPRYLRRPIRKFPRSWKGGLDGEVAYAQHCAWYIWGIRTIVVELMHSIIFFLRSGVIIFNISVFLGLSLDVQVGGAGQGKLQRGEPLVYLLSPL